MPTPIEIEIIQEHLPYEIDMLRATYQLLVATSPPAEVIKNALIESFCVHARSLLDFFENRANKSDDYAAQNFTSGFSVRINTSIDPLYTLRQKLNKQIFHLTGGRSVTGANKFDPGTDGTLVLRELEAEIGRFQTLLRSEFRALFTCNTVPTVVFVTGPLGPSSHTTSVVWSSYVPASTPTPTGGRP
jgi:hypothetical protein